MNYYVTQPDLFGNEVKYAVTDHRLKFCLKMHYAEKAGLHYDLRLQVPEASAKNTSNAFARSFVLKNGPSLNPHHKPLATMVDDHKVNSFRREGTILRGVGIGAVLHFDEGFFTIPGCQTPKETYEAFHKAMVEGKLKVFFTGHKMKGEFHFYRKTIGRYSQWIIQKANDDFASEENLLARNKSILTGHSLQHYLDIYYKQKQIMHRLSTEDLDSLFRANDAASFQYKDKEIVGLV